MRHLQSLALATLLLVPAFATAQQSGPAVQFLSFDGSPDKRLYTETWSPESPRAVIVFSHGFIDNARNHRHMYAALVAAGYAVTAWDQIGHGESFGPRGWVDRFDDFVRALDVVKKATQARYPHGFPIYVMGHSLGALVTLRYAELHDAEIDGSLELAPFLQPRLNALQHVMNALSSPLDHLAPHLRLPHGVTVPMVLRDPALLPERLADPYFFKTITVHLYRQFLAGIEATKADVGKIHKPLIFLVPGDDLIVVPAATDAFYARLPADNDHTYVGFPSSRHDLQSDIGREKVYATLLGWLHDHVHARDFDALYGR